jgi:hypothetical protein
LKFPKTNLRGALNKASGRTWKAHREPARPPRHRVSIFTAAILHKDGRTL